MYDYYIRCTQADYKTMLALGVTLGALVVDPEGNISAPGGAWDEIGTIYKPTGKMIDTPEGPTPEMAPVLDAKSKPYFHANLRTPTHLGLKAKELAANDPKVAKALADQARWFVTAEGQAAAPKQPTRGWL